MPPYPVAVEWEVASDPGMRNIVRDGSELAMPGWAHSIHVEVDGLVADRWYWYRFIACGEVSPVARSRTMPPITSNPERLRFAIASCQHWEQGYFTALGHLAKENVDLVLHLGDYIYENGAGTATACIRPHHGDELLSLSDYRNRHAQYKSDPDLQSAHASAPWLVTFDDHEVDNNYAGRYSEQLDVAPEQFLVRRAAAYQAYFEHMPLRHEMRPVGSMLPLYRSIDFGDLARFNILDTRQYRSDQPCGDGKRPLCDETRRSDATMLGNAQKAWLYDSLGNSHAQWNVLAQQVLMAHTARRSGEDLVYSMDQWSGYQNERDEILGYLADNAIRNPVVLTGDIHSNWVNDLKLDFSDPSSRMVATEIVCTSISSEGDSNEVFRDSEFILQKNPFVKFVNDERGYVFVEMTRRSMVASFRIVPYVSRRGAPLVRRATFRIDDSTPGAHRIAPG